jgi:hypothetical protein
MALRACSALLLLVALVSCSADGGERARPSPSATYELPERPVRDGEKAVKAGTARSGETAFTLIGYTGGMAQLVGSHADVAPEGQYVRVRVMVENKARANQKFVAADQLLVTASGRTAAPDIEAMLIKRQPQEFLLGAAVRIELDLWWDIPRAERPVAVRFHGAPALGAVNDPAPAQVRLP